MIEIPASKLAILVEKAERERKEHFRGRRLNTDPIALRYNFLDMACAQRNTARLCPDDPQRKERLKTAVTLENLAFAIDSADHALLSHLNNIVEQHAHGEHEQAITDAIGVFAKLNR
jgi:hypothetical protein